MSSTKDSDYVAKILDAINTNDFSGLTPENIDFMNSVMYLCNNNINLNLNVTKKFDTEAKLISHIKSVREKEGQILDNQNVFKPEFAVSKSVIQYANRFFRGNINYAVKNISNSLKYMLANAVVRDRPLPSPLTNVAYTYLQLLVNKAKIPLNMSTYIRTEGRDSVNSKPYSVIAVINEIINNVIDDIFTGKHYNYYFITLNDDNKALIQSFKDNIRYLTRSSIKPMNIFEYIATEATKAGKKDAVAPTKADQHDVPQNQCQESLTELAFQNQALLSYMFQNINYSNKKRKLL